MGQKLYVGNLAFNATDDELRDFFSPMGEVESVRIIRDRETGRSRGFGFVEMKSDDAARQAIEQLDGKEFKGRPLRISEARSREGEGGGGGGGGGGFRRGHGGGGHRR